MLCLTRVEATSQTNQVFYAHCDRAESALHSRKQSPSRAPRSRIFDGPAGEGESQAHKTSNSVDVSDEHKCDDFGHGQRDGEVQDVSDKEA